ncbi:hypothetical protein Clacol_003826 [Clathrus columnatus]|uniref:Uncharacterized protein n=1 Tax=Clathrus columnatus TaxID=1419009 RepID=A0AAV5A811_9AGAM|nr:hypothetical protein Clacol_003826 [Clathrus columnatus]
MSSTLKVSPLDWLSFPPTSPSDVHAPHPDLFDLDLEASIIALPQVDQEQLQHLNIDLTDTYAFLPTNATPRCGPPSTLTASSESTYDSYSESLYNYSEYESNPTDYSADLGIDFSKFTVDVDAAAAEAKAQLMAAAAAASSLNATRSNTPNNIVKQDPDSVLHLLPNLDLDVSSSGASNSPDNSSASSSSPNSNDLFAIPFMSTSDVNLRSSYDSLNSAAVAAALSAHSQSPATDYYPSAIYGYKHLPAAQNTISPTNLLPGPLARLPIMIRSLDHNKHSHQAHSQPQQQSHASLSPTPSNSNSTGSTPPLDNAEQKDPRKKYKCPACPRAFARAYNLKTHQQTHDPNRLKPHTCPHRSCGRSFSRKHDLGRHLVSIHRDEPVSASSGSGAENSKNTSNHNNIIGVSQGPRGWCDHCGAGWVGKEATCACRDLK